MPLPLVAIPVVAGAAVGLGVVLKEAFKMAKEGKQPSQEKQTALKSEEPSVDVEPS